MVEMEEKYQEYQQYQENLLQFLPYPEDNQQQQLLGRLPQYLQCQDNLSDQLSLMEAIGTQNMLNKLCLQ